MYKYLAIAGLLLTSAAVFFSQQGASLQASQTADLYQQYQQWQIKYGKAYTNEQDNLYRFGVWVMNKMFVDSGVESTSGMNIMADLTNEEFRARYINQYKSVKSESAPVTFHANPNYTAPSSVDWVSKGGVAPVQDQGQCGSCWAFGTVGGLEGLWFVTSGNLVKMSEQQLVDCSRNGNFGCSGGLEIYAYQYTAEKGIQTESSYPYFSGTTGKRGECKYDSSDVVYKNKSYFEVEKDSIPAIEQALEKQPLSKGIAASSLVFQLYNGGVLNSQACGTDIDHSVTLVGYNNDASTPYWTIKNSWGTGWGEKGYINVAKSDNGESGVCAVNEDSTGPSM